MSLAITQQPVYLNLSQSPIIFTIKESANDILTQPTFQYNAKLYYWTGDITNVPTTEQYSIVKYKNQSGYGIFDLSKILNSLFTESLLNNGSNVWYFKLKFFTSYYNGTSWVYGADLDSDIHKVIEGYKVFDDNVSGEINQITEFFPFLTDGPDEQFYYLNNTDTRVSVFSGILDQNNVNPFAYPTRIVYSVKINDSWYPTYSSIQNTLGTTSFLYNLTNYGSYETDKMIESIPVSPEDVDFPISSAILGNKPFYITAINSGNTKLGTPILFNFNCEGRYENITIKFKNRFGQFDNFNFNLVSKKTFNSENVSYTKQIGDWSGTAFSYSQSDYYKQNFASTQTQFITVNTDFVDEKYNYIFQQMLVSDEIYWISTRDIPLVLTSNAFVKKSEKVDKLIQYTFTFEYSQPYKIII